MFFELIASRDGVLPIILIFISIIIIMAIINIITIIFIEFIFIINIFNIITINFIIYIFIMYYY